MWLFFAFVAVPLIEIALFIRLGGAIGLWPTLLIVVLTAVFGAWLVRVQGAETLERLRGSLRDLRDPTDPLAHGAMILFAGALLLTPGFFTDSIGFLLLFPHSRALVWRYLRTRVQVRGFSVGNGPKRPQDWADDPDTIDGIFDELPPEKHPTHDTSRRTRH